MLMWEPNGGWLTDKIQHLFFQNDLKLFKNSQPYTAGLKKNIQIDHQLVQILDWPDPDVHNQVLEDEGNGVRIANLVKTVRIMVMEV